MILSTITAFLLPSSMPHHFPIIMERMVILLTVVKAVSADEKNADKIISINNMISIVKDDVLKCIYLNSVYL